MESDTYEGVGHVCITFKQYVTYNTSYSFNENVSDFLFGSQDGGKKGIA